MVLAFFFGYLLTSTSVLRAGMSARYGGQGRPGRRHGLDPGDGDRRQPGAALVPGALHAGLLDALFWGSLVFSLVVAFVVTVPVNRAMISRGRGHAAAHAYHH